MAALAFVQGTGIDLTAAAGGEDVGLDSVDDVSTINFRLGTEVTVEMPRTQPPPLSIVTIGDEYDPTVTGGFCGPPTIGLGAFILQILRAPPSTWFDALHDLQVGASSCPLADRLGFINKIFDPLSGWAEGVHVDNSDTRDFTLQYTIEVFPPGVGSSDPGSSSCTNNLPISSVTSSPSQNTFPPTKAIDNDFNTKWFSTNSLNPFITLDLGSQQTICSVDIAWADGDVHPYNFTISVSNDGTNFTNVLSGRSTGTTTATEKYLVPLVQAKFVKVTITQSTPGSPNSIVQISEIDAFSRG